MSGRKQSWLQRIRRWISRLFGGRTTVNRGPTILREFESEFIRLLMLDAPYSDEEVERIRAWKAILRSQSDRYDILVVCDRLKRCRADVRAGEIRRFVTTHRFAAFRIARIPVKGKTRVDQLFIAELDCIRAQVFRGMDGFAPQIADSLAMQLRKRSLAELEMLLDVGDTLESRKLVRKRWAGCLLYYHNQYFPEVREY